MRTKKCSNEIYYRNLIVMHRRCHSIDRKQYSRKEKYRFNYQKDLELYEWIY